MGFKLCQDAHHSTVIPHRIGICHLLRRQHRPNQHCLIKSVRLEAVSSIFELTQDQTDTTYQLDGASSYRVLIHSGGEWLRAGEKRRSGVCALVFEAA